MRQHRFDFDLFAERRPQQPRGIDDQGVDVGAARLQRLTAGEGQQMLGQVGAPRGRGGDQVGDLGEMGALLDRVAEDFDGSGDHGQDVVEVVRDAAGELADGLHLLRLPDLGFGGLDLPKTLHHGLGLAALPDFLLERRIGSLDLNARRQHPQVAAAAAAVPP